MKDLSELTFSYIGPNTSHKIFKKKLVSEKAFLYIFNSNKDQLLSFFNNMINNGRKQLGNNFSLGFVTKGISQTQFKGIKMPCNEINLILSDKEKFILDIHEKSLINIYTIFISYLLSLYSEILNLKPEILKMRNSDIKIKKIIDGLKENTLLDMLIEDEIFEIGTLRFDKFVDKFNKIRLPIFDDSLGEKQSIEKRFKLLWFTRNILIHNDGIINDEFLKNIQDANYKKGDRINVTLEILGENIALIETLADNINKRAIDKIK